MSKQGYVKKATECLEVTISNVPRHTETKQSLCNENHMAGLWKVISGQTVI